MKALHIGKYFPPYAGGMETYLRDLMTAQARQGIEPSALVHQSDISFSSADESYPAGDQQLPVTRAAVWARLLFTPISPTFPWLLNRLINERQPDILHLHMPNVSAFWALLLPSTRKIPWVIQWQSDVLASEHNLGLRLFYIVYRPFERAILRRSKAIIASSPPYLESSSPLRPYRDKCVVIPLGLDPNSLRSPPTQQSGGASDKLRVLAIGRLTYYKGFEHLIRAATDVENVEIHIIGTGNLDATLKQLAQNLGVFDKITFHGELSPGQLAEEYTACDCFCLPSIERTEAYGLVLLEAMYFGKAVIASDVPGSGMGWIVDDGVTGLKVKPGDAAALASALQQFQADRDSLSGIGENGRYKFDQQFHINQSTSSITALYSRISEASLQQRTQ